LGIENQQNGTQQSAVGQQYMEPGVVGFVIVLGAGYVGRMERTRSSHASRIMVRKAE